MNIKHFRTQCKDVMIFQSGSAWDVLVGVLQAEGSSSICACSFLSCSAAEKAAKVSDYRRNWNPLCFSAIRSPYRSGALAYCRRSLEGTEALNIVRLWVGRDVLSEPSSGARASGAAYSLLCPQAAPRPCWLHCTLCVQLHCYNFFLRLVELQKECV